MVEEILKSLFQRVHTGDPNQSILKERWPLRMGLLTH
jgi:hypothetical protein